MMPDFTPRGRACALNPSQAATLTARHMAALTGGGVIDRHTVLISLPEAQAIIAEIDASLDRRAVPAEVELLVRRLMGAYRRGDWQNPDVFIDLLSDLFSDYPASIGFAAVGQLVRGLTFPPSIAEVARALAGMVAHRKGLRWRALKHIAEAERRAHEAAVERDRADPAAARQVSRQIAGVIAGFRRAAAGIGGEGTP